MRLRLLVVGARDSASVDPLPNGDRWEYVHARSFEEALVRLDAHPVDCILVDLSGTERDETCRRLKSNDAARDTPLVILTSSDDPDAAVRGFEAGADDCASTSDDRRALEARLLAHVRRRRLAEANRRIRDDVVRRETEAHAAAEARASLLDEIERKDKELDAFSYSVSHDLRAPLRSIDGFSQALLEDLGEQLDESASDHLRRVRAAAGRMDELIEGLLALSRIGRAAMRIELVDISELARAAVADLRASNAERSVEVSIEEGVMARGDVNLLRVVVEQLLANAWKFTSRCEQTKIEIGATRDETRTTYFVKDNGAGFDMQYAEKLFAPFQRLHAVRDYPGTGMGLVTARRIVERHGGHIVAEGRVGQGACVSWSLTSPKGRI